MGKASKRKPRPAYCPTLVARFNRPEVELKEWSAVDALQNGRAESAHFNLLLDIADLLLLSTTDKADATGVAEVCHAGRLALESIKDRFFKTHRLGASGEELKMLRVLVDVSNDWWSRQSGLAYIAAHAALDKFREYQRDDNKKDAEQT